MQATYETAFRIENHRRAARWTRIFPAAARAVAAHVSAPPEGAPWRDPDPLSQLVGLSRAEQDRMLERGFLARR